MASVQPRYAATQNAQRAKVIVSRIGLKPKRLYLKRLFPPSISCEDLGAILISKCERERQRGSADHYRGTQRVGPRDHRYGTPAIGRASDEAVLRFGVAIASADYADLESEFHNQEF